MTLIRLTAIVMLGNYYQYHNLQCLWMFLHVHRRLLVLGCFVASFSFLGRAKRAGKYWLVIGRYFCWGDTIFVELEFHSFSRSMQRQNDSLEDGSEKRLADPLKVLCNHRRVRDARRAKKNACKPRIVGQSIASWDHGRFFMY